MFHYFPDSYMWSHAMLLGLGAIPWGGGEIGEIDQVGARLKDKVGDYTTWHDEWLAMANRVRQLARDAEAKGRRETGRETYLRACNYYNLAERFVKPGSANKIETYRQGLACFAKAAALFDPPIERVRVPYEGSFLPAYFLPAEGRKTSHLAPTVVFFDGLDAAKEQLYLIGGRQLVKHGMNCLIVDGPGNGEALAINEIYLREDYERPAGAAIDYLETRLPHLRLAGGEARRLAGRSADRSINRGLWGGGTTQIEAPRACIRAVDPAPGLLD